MARITLEKQIDPITPPTNFITFYPQGSSIKYKDETGTVYTLATGISPEEVQDIVGAMLVNTSNITLTYDDPGNSFSSDLTNTGVTAGTYATASSVSQLTVDVKGRVTSITNVSISIASSQVISFITDVRASISVLSSANISLTYSAGQIGADLTNTTVTAAAYGSATQVATYTVDAKGRLTASANVAILIPTSQITNFTTDVRASISVLSSANISLTYSAGQISANLTDTAVTPGAYGSATQVATYTVDQKGRLTLGESVSISIPTSQIVSFTTDVRAAISVLSSANISLTYSSGQIGANLTDTAVTPGAYGSASQISTFTVDQKGRLTAASQITPSVTSVTGTLPIANGGTGQTSKTNAYDALSPNTTNGDITFYNGTDNVRLPIGSTGQVLTTIGTQPEWVSPSNFNPSTSIVIYDDFEGPNTPPVFSHGWQSSTTGGGSAVLTAVAGEINTFGVASLSPGTTATGRASLILAATTTNFGNGQTDYTWRIRIPVLSTATQRFIVTVGFGDNIAAGDQVDGVYFSYSDNVNGGNWQLNTANNSVRTTADSATAPSTNYVRLRMNVNAAGTLVTYFINNTNVGTIATNIPNTLARQSGPLIKIEKTVGTTATLLLTDYFYLTAAFTTPR